jgi:hypothetical protein
VVQIRTLVSASTLVVVLLEEHLQWNIGCRGWEAILDSYVVEKPLFWISAMVNTQTYTTLITYKVQETLHVERGKIVSR